MYLVALMYQGSYNKPLLPFEDFVTTDTGPQLNSINAFIPYRATQPIPKRRFSSIKNEFPSLEQAIEGYVETFLTLESHQLLAIIRDSQGAWARLYNPRIAIKIQYGDIRDEYLRRFASPQ